MKNTFQEFFSNLENHVPYYMFILAICIATLIMYIKKLINDTYGILSVLTFLIIISSKISYDFKKTNRVITDNSNKIDQLESLIIDPKDYVSFSPQIADSKFQFENMFEKAKKSIFVVGPNLAFLSEKDHWLNMQILIFNKLRYNPEFKFKLLLLNPRNEDICKIMSKHAFTSMFLPELDRSVVVFNEWMKEANSSGLTNIEIYVTDLITFSLTIVDLKESDGCVLVSPIVPKKSGGSRPCFLIKKKSQYTAFEKYCESCKGLFKEAIPISDIFNSMPKDAKNLVFNELIKELQPNSNKFKNISKDMKDRIIEELKKELEKNNGDS